MTKPSDKNELTVAFYERFAPLYSFIRYRLHQLDSSAKKELIDEIIPFHDDVVLDIGSGPGIYAITIAQSAPSCRVIGVDLSPRFIQISREKAIARGVENVEFMEGKIESLDFDDNTFSKIICAGVLSVCSDSKAAVKELNRVLKSDGKLVVREPLRKTNIINKAASMISGRSAHKFGLMFGNFNPDFFIEEELSEALSRGGFNHISVRTKGSDLFGYCVK